MKEAEGGRDGGKMRCGFSAPDRQPGMTGVVDRHRCTAGETGLDA